MHKLFILMSLFTLNAWAQSFPLGPHPQLTPGSLCDTPTSYRYQERVPYCERDVGRETKDQIFKNYERAGYRFKAGERSSYKIDHYIPLCAGGSNHDNNLWPQHISVYTLTDPVEALACEKLQKGKITQRQMIDIIRAVKNDLSLTKDYIRELQKK